MDTQQQSPIVQAQTTDSFQFLNLMIRFKNAFMQLWILIVAASILLGSLSWYRAKRSFVPMYETKALFTVDAGDTPEDIFGTGAYYDQYAAEQLAGVFPWILSTDMMNDLVIYQLDKGYINGSARAEAVAGSNMLSLAVTSNNPRDAYDYLCAIIECYPQVAVFMVDNPQVKIVTRPTIPTEAYNSFNGTKALITGALIGAVIALIVIFLCALMARTIQTTDELKSAVNLPILIALPKVDLKKRRSGTKTLITAEADPNMTESIRGLRMKVKKMLKDSDSKVILLTSTLAREGKTTISINLASALVRDGHKVLLLDADLHSQSVARSLEEDTEHDGLMECLESDDPTMILNCVRKNKAQNLYFISGRSTDKRHYTLDLNKVNRMLNELKKKYDYIVIDTPPNDVVSDAMALCRCANCVLYVIRQDHVQRNQVINSIASMHAKGVVIDGCIFNGVPKFHRQYGYGYRYGYGYGYDYGNKKYHYGDKYASSNKYGKYGYYSSSAYAPKKPK